MRFILQVITDNGVIAFISEGTPCQCFHEIINGNVTVVPYRMIVSGCIGLCGMDIDNDFHTVLLAERQDIIEYLQRIHRIEFFVISVVVVGSGVFSVLPLKQEFGAHGNSEHVKTMVCDRLERICQIAVPYTVKKIRPGVVSEPVAAG